MKTIGILGGMGPEASADIYLKIIKRSYNHAAENMDAYPHILINNIPRPNIFQRFDTETGAYLAEQAYILEIAGAKAIGIACNSAHYYWADMRAALSANIWLVDMISQVARRVSQEGFIKVGILSSAMSRPLYEKAALNHHCQPCRLLENEQKQVDAIIARILAGERTPTLKTALRSLADDQIRRGSDCVVLGCTDLPLILSQADVEYPLVTSNDILADALFHFAVNDHASSPEI